MSRYNAEFPFPVAYPPQAMTNVLAEWLAKHEVKQAHIAGQSSSRTHLHLNRLTIAYRDGEIRARDVLLQRRRRETIRERRAAPDRLSKSRYVRSTAKDERRRSRKKGGVCRA
jgi:hypothetical protein